MSYLMIIETEEQRSRRQIEEQRSRGRRGTYFDTTERVNSVTPERALKKIEILRRMYGDKPHYDEMERRVRLGYPHLQKPTT